MFLILLILIMVMIGDDEDCSGVEYSCVVVVMEDADVGVVVVK